MDRLEGMAEEGAITGGKLVDLDGKDAENPLESEDAVKGALKAGVVPALISMSHRKENEGIRRSLGRIP